MSERGAQASGRARRLAGSRRRGQSVVEFGIIAVIFFLLVSGIVDFGRALNAWVVVSTASREGARVAAVGSDLATITARARSFALAPGVDPATVEVEVTPDPSTLRTDDPVTVRVTADEFEVVTPLVRLVFGCPGSDPHCYVPISSQTTTRYEGRAL